MNDTELVERWIPTLLNQVNTEIAKAGKQRTPLPPSPFGRTAAGLADFRGFTLREKIVRLAIEDHDLSWTRCEWAGAFIECRVKGSVLDRLKIDGRYVGTTI